MYANKRKRKKQICYRSGVTRNNLYKLHGLFVTTETFKLLYLFDFVIRYNKFEFPPRLSYLSSRRCCTTSYKMRNIDSHRF